MLRSINRSLTFISLLNLFLLPTCNCHFISFSTSLFLFENKSKCIIFLFPLNINTEVGWCKYFQYLPWYFIDKPYISLHIIYSNFPHFLLQMHITLFRGGTIYYLTRPLLMNICFVLFYFFFAVFCILKIMLLITLYICYFVFLLSDLWDYFFQK